MKKYENPSILVMTIQNEDVFTLLSGADENAVISWADGFDLKTL